MNFDTRNYTKYCHGEIKQAKNVTSLRRFTWNNISRDLLTPYYMQFFPQNMKEQRQSRNFNRCLLQNRLCSLVSFKFSTGFFQTILK